MHLSVVSGNRKDGNKHGNRAWWFFQVATLHGWENEQGWLHGENLYHTDVGLGEEKG